VTAERFDLVMVANRLPMDVSVAEDGSLTWTRSPGGLVTALESVMKESDGAWVGWPGAHDTEVEPFDAGGMRLVPVSLSEEEVADYYEGFSNDTLWPLCHDVIEPPAFHRQWWEAYRRVNQRFADAAVAQAAEGGVVWVHDYQLQLVPAMVRQARPDLRIGYFHHIPFPPLEIFAQLPWRRQIIDGLLGADLVGFQRAGDAANFVRSVRRLTDLSTRGQVITLPEEDEEAVVVQMTPDRGGASRRPAERYVRAASFPISIDSRKFDALARSAEVQQRAREIRSELGDPNVLLLGVDRLDYTKGISHRIKAFGELLEDERLTVPDTTLVQVASPSRENVGAYQQLRDDVEVLVGRINGEFGALGHAAIHYMHHSYPMEEMAALYLAADVMLVTALRDGMNLVAKEYVAARYDERGALVLSEFAGAADQLAGAIMVNPHDIDGLKDAITYAAHLDPRESRKRMRRLRRGVMEDDVAKWSASFLAVLAAVPRRAPRPDADEATTAPASGSTELDAAVDRFAAVPRDGGRALVALDFDGALAPLQDDPEASRALPAAVDALAALGAVPGLSLALISGRGLADLADKAEVPDGTILVGSHGAERGHWSHGELHRDELVLEPTAAALHRELTSELQAAVIGSAARVECKPASVVLHTRGIDPADAERLTTAALALGDRPGVDAMRGKDVVELAVLRVTKGDVLADLRRELAADALLYAGDDVTDERAFAALRPDDLTVKVGPGDTAARFRVADPAGLTSVLQSLARRFAVQE
jgi:trehalose 6-phosphate synthase/phosphatase